MYEFFKLAYKNGWATKDDLTQAVVLGLITQEQMDAIINASLG